MNADLQRYILTHIESEPSLLADLDRDANIELINPRMNSGHLQGRFLKMLVAIARPRKILELGTFGGYSTLCLAEGLEEGGEVVTLEIDDEKEDFIANHLRKSPFGHRVRTIFADAKKVLPEMASSSFDMIFLDSDKRDYPQLYPLCKRLLKPQGLLIADNVLWNGHITDSRYDHDAQTSALREFNDIVAEDDEVDVVILPLRDGLSLIRLKKQN